jgi:hypothetical protein
MMPNPYEAPSAASSSTAPPSVNRTPLLLAAISAGLASIYWAVMTLLLALSATFGSTSYAYVVMPCVLIVLYALRASQILKGDVLAARRLLWLHIVGGGFAVLQMTTDVGFMVTLHAIKVGIHVFGAVTVVFAQRAITNAANGTV